MEKTKIEWCESTWNPVTGCYHDCEYCYARRIAERFGRAQKYANIFELDEPERGADGKAKAYPHSFSPTLHRYRLGDYKSKSGRTIFVCSMADLFGDWVPDGWIEEVFKACKEAPQHRYLFLTKNPQRYLTLAKNGRLPTEDNYWYGTTVTTPDGAYFHSDRHKTFISIEPIQADFETGDSKEILTDWIIVGAETGNRKDKAIPEKSWIIAVEKKAGWGHIPLFFKDSLIPIVGEEGMLREFPWKRGGQEN